MIYGIVSAKREGTKAKRLAALIAISAEGRRARLTDRLADLSESTVGQILIPVGDLDAAITFYGIASALGSCSRRRRR
jgi:hypothetical protein